MSDQPDNSGTTDENGQVEGFGRSGYMHLSPTNLGGKGTFFIGLALEF